MVLLSGCRSLKNQRTSSLAQKVTIISRSITIKAKDNADALSQVACLQCGRENRDEIQILMETTLMSKMKQICAKLSCMQDPSIWFVPTAKEVGIISLFRIVSETKEFRPGDSFRYVTRFWKSWLITQKLKFELLLVLNSSIFAELWMLTRTVLTKHCSEKNVFFVVPLLMWASQYISVNYPWYEHANSCRKR